MKRILKAIFFVLVVSYALVSCKQNKANTQDTQAAQAPVNGVNGEHTDSFVHPAMPANANIPDGKNVEKWPNGVIKMQGYYKGGRRQGEWQSFFQNGKLNSDEVFVDGQTNGKVIVYYENGQKRYEGENNNGKLTGVWNYWDEKGKLVRSVDYSKQAPGQNP